MKLLWPYLDVLDRGTARSPRAAERRWLLLADVDTDVHNSERYVGAACPKVGSASVHSPCFVDKLSKELATVTTTLSGLPTKLPTDYGTIFYKLYYIKWSKLHSYVHWHTQALSPLDSWPRNNHFQGSHYILVVNSRTFQGPWSCIFKDQFSTKVYSINSMTAIFNICFCDYGTVLVDKNKTSQLLTNLVLGKIPGRFLSK